MAFDIVRSSHLEGVVAVGLDSGEVGNPPERFAGAFDMARNLGLRTVAHAGEEGPPEYVTAALDVLGAERIDHGIRSLEDPKLVERLVLDQIPLTVCPLSNVALNVVDSLADHPLPSMLKDGLLVSIHSDDPAYFGGYVADNYHGVATSLGLGPSDLAKLANNSVVSSFLDNARKDDLLLDVEQVLSRHQS